MVPIIINLKNQINNNKNIKLQKYQVNILKNNQYNLKIKFKN